jgi:hypothetical protein
MYNNETCVDSLGKSNNVTCNIYCCELPLEIVYHIFDYNKDGATYKSILFLCKSVHDKYIGKRNKFCNHLLTIVSQHPDAKYDWKNIMNNKNISANIIINNEKLFKCWVENWRDCLPLKLDITIGMIRRYAYDHTWSNNYNYWWESFSCNPAIKMSDIENNPTSPWKYHKVSSNPNLTIEFIKKYRNTKDFNWIAVSQTLPINIIQTEIESEDISSIKIRTPLIFTDNEHDDTYGPSYVLKKTHGWVWIGLCTNPTLTIEFIKKYSNCGKDLTLQELAAILANPGIKMPDILNNLNELYFPIITNTITRNPNLTEKYLDIFIEMCRANEYPFKQGISESFDWEELSRHKSISMEYIVSHPDLPWSWGVNNPNEEGTVWSNPNLTIGFLEKWVKEKCDNDDNLMSLMQWDFISSNIGIKMEDIEKHPKYPWDWNGICANPNLTYEFVNKHINDPLNWLFISCNTFSGHRND